MTLMRVFTKRGEITQKKDTYATEEKKGNAKRMTCLLLNRNMLVEHSFCFRFVLFFDVARYRFATISTDKFVDVCLQKTVLRIIMQIENDYGVTPFGTRK